MEFLALKEVMKVLNGGVDGDKLAANNTAFLFAVVNSLEKWLASHLLKSTNGYKDILGKIDESIRSGIGK